MPACDQQTALRASLTELQPVLVSRARKLISRLRDPKPDPLELVNEVARRLLASYSDDQIDSARRLAFTTLARVAIDVARRYRFDGGFIEDDAQVPDHAPTTMDPFVRTALAELPEVERDVVIRIVVEGVAVPRAFEMCGWVTKSPYPEYDKIIKKLHERLQERSR